MKPLEQQIHAILDRRTAGLDGYSLSRLHRARAHAIAAAQGHGGRVHTWLAPALGLGMAVAAVLLWWQPGYEQAPPRPAAMQQIDATTLELALMDVDVELVEDLDFYLWLSERNPPSS
jgi:hypothetical protein